MRTCVRVLMICVVSAMLMGCVSIPRDELQVVRYSLDATPVTSTADTTLPLTLQIIPFQANAQQRGERILFRAGPQRMDYYFYHRWIVSPEKMLSDALAENLQEWNLFAGGILQTETGIIPTHEVYGRLNKLYAVNIRNQYKAVLEITLTLIRIEPATYEKTIIYQWTYPIEVERDDNRVDSFIESANLAVEEWLSRVRSDVRPIFESEAALFRPDLLEQAGDQRLHQEAPDEGEDGSRRLLLRRLPAMPTHDRPYRPQGVAAQPAFSRPVRTSEAADSTATEADSLVEDLPPLDFDELPEFEEDGVETDTTEVDTSQVE